MAEIRLYRQFYCFSNNGSGTTSQTIIDPYYISATTTTVSGTTIIETPTPVQESLGVYYVDLSPIKYSFSTIYELSWYVNYFNGVPIKRLPTRFKVNPINIGSQVDIEIENYPIEIEIGGLGF